MRVVGSIVQFIGGGIGRVALSGVLIGIFFVGVGVTPWQFAAQTIQHPPHLIANPWFSPRITLVGLVLIAASLWFNLWSRKQKTIDDLAEDMAWSVHNLLNRTPPPSTPEMIAI
jgi:hypothetical protein